MECYVFDFYKRYIRLTSDISYKTVERVDKTCNKAAQTDWRKKALVQSKLNLSLSKKYILTFIMSTILRLRLSKSKWKLITVLSHNHELQRSCPEWQSRKGCDIIMLKYRCYANAQYCLLKSERSWLHRIHTMKSKQKAARND